MNYYKRHLGDYARDAGHLTALEHGIYTLLIDWYYVNEAPIPDSRAHRIARSRREEVAPVLEEFFVRVGDVWQHKRIDREIELYRAKAAKARDSASLRWAQGSADVQPADGGTHANAVQTQCDGNASHKPLATSHTSPSGEVAARTLTEKRFVAPTVEEVRQYCALQGLDAVDPERFCAYYGSQGWRVGRNPMKSWHLAAAGWQARERGKVTQAGQGSTRQRTLQEDLMDRSWAASGT